MCQSHTTLLVLWYSCLGPSCLDKFGKNLGSAKTCPSLDYFKPRYIDSMLFKLLNVLPPNLRTLFENNLHDVFNNVTPPNVSNLFTYSSKIHKTTFSMARNFHLQHSKTDHLKNSFSSIMVQRLQAMKAWNS